VFSLRKESIVGTTDHDSNDKVELEVPTQGGATPSSLPHSSSRVHIDEPNSSTSSPDEPQVEDICSIAHDRLRKTIRKPACYATNNENALIAYAQAIAQETPKGIEPSTYFEAIFCPNSLDWLMEMQENIESLYKNRTWDLCELAKGRRALTAK